MYNSPLPIVNYGIKFVLDGVQELFDDTAPYEVTFTGLSQAEHVVDAILVEVPSHNVYPFFYTPDQEIQIGIGDYYVAMGDSIINGWGDGIAIDNISLDGRNGVGGDFDGGSGYPPVLNDILTAAKGYPHTVVNEGINGTQSWEGLAQIGTLLTNHPEAQFFLIGYGTNDAGKIPPIPSGEGLVQGDGGYPGSFKDIIQQIITAIVNDGKTAYLPKIPYVRGFYSGKLPAIQEYNRVIDELVTESGISVVPPDFYTYFEVNHLAEFADDQHPNGTGYQSMANEWFFNLP